MAVIMFQHRFAPLVESGQKRQTIRPKRKRPIKAGDKLSLRQWTDKPYRSKQRVLREEACIAVKTVSLRQHNIHVDGVKVVDEDSFAKADGFYSAGDMAEWFRNTHGLPFEGVLIKW